MSACFFDPRCKTSVSWFGTGFIRTDYYHCFMMMPIMKKMMLLLMMVLMMIMTLMCMHFCISLLLAGTVTINIGA